VTDNGSIKSSHTIKICPLHPYLRTLPRRTSKTDFGTHSKASSTSDGQGRRDTKVLIVYSDRRLETAHAVHWRLYVHCGCSFVFDPDEARRQLALHISHAGGRLRTVSDGHSVLASCCEYCVGFNDYLGWDKLIGRCLESLLIVLLLTEVVERDRAVLCWLRFLFRVRDDRRATNRCGPGRDT
jgi:hypothetical protein